MTGLNPDERTSFIAQHKHEILQKLHRAGPVQMTNISKPSVENPTTTNTVMNHVKTPPTTKFNFTAKDGITNSSQTKQVITYYNTNTINC